MPPGDGSNGLVRANHQVRQVGHSNRPRFTLRQVVLCSLREPPVEASQLSA